MQEQVVVRCLVRSLYSTWSMILRVCFVLLTKYYYSAWNVALMGGEELRRQVLDGGI